MVEMEDRRQKMEDGRQRTEDSDEIHGKMAMYFFILLPFYKV